MFSPYIATFVPGEMAVGVYAVLSMPLTVILKFSAQSLLAEES